MDVTGNRAIAVVRADMPSRTRTVTVQPCAACTRRPGAAAKAAAASGVESVTE